MAKQAGLFNITGTMDGVTFYRLEKDYYVRKKSSLSGKRVKKDPAFAETMKYANLLAKASMIASAAYRLLPKDKRNRRLYQELTGKAMRGLKEGLKENEVMVELKNSLPPNNEPVRIGRL